MCGSQWCPGSNQKDSWPQHLNYQRLGSNHRSIKWWLKPSLWLVRCLINSALETRYLKSSHLQKNLSFRIFELHYVERLMSRKWLWTVFHWCFLRGGASRSDLWHHKLFGEQSWTSAEITAIQDFCQRRRLMRIYLTTAVWPQALQSDHCCRHINCIFNGSVLNRNIHTVNM